MGKSFQKKYGPWALITGASAGIGEAFARSLAERGLNLALVARRGDVLEQTANQLRAKHGVECKAIACDLAQEDFMSVLEPALGGVEVGLLVNNAGFSNTGNLVDNELERELALLYLNCRAPLVLAHHFGRVMKARGRGGIIFLSSVAGTAAVPVWANYSASKAYDLFLGEAMHHEMRGDGVDVLAVCPGAVRTEFGKAANIDLNRMPKLMQSITLEPEEVVASALRALGRKPSVVVGLANNLMAFSGRFTPRSVLSKTLGKSIRDIEVR